MRVHLGSDHAGFELKAHLAEQLGELGYEVVDHGPVEYDPVDDYPPYVLRAAAAVVNDPGSLGVVIGGSGNGEQIAANKVRGVRAALAWNDDTAGLGREHNDANVVSIGARMHTPGRGHPAGRAVPDHAVQRRRAARPADRDDRALRADRRSCRSCPRRSSSSDPRPLH